MAAPTVFECSVHEAVLRCVEALVNPSYSADVWKPLLSTFVGAMFAFSAARLMDWTKRYRERLAAGNFALFALQTQRKDFGIFRKLYFKDVTRESVVGKPIWLINRPTLQTFVARDINFESLTFLFEKAGRNKLFEDLHLCQELTMDMRGSNGRRNEILSEVHRMADKHQNIAEAEQAIGTNLVRSAKQVVREMGIRADSSFDKRLVNAFNSLREALSYDLELAPRRILRQQIPWFRNRLAPPPLIELKALDADLLLDSLPEISVDLRRRLGLRQQESGKKIAIEELEE